MLRSKIVAALILSILFVGSAAGQKKIKWLTWEEVQEKSKVEKKKILVDMYTQWCGWCKKMDKSTLRDEFIVDYVNENFYAVKFDVESKEEVLFGDEIYAFQKYGKKGYHSLAITLTKGKLRLPAVVFLDENYEILQPINGFQDAKRFEKIITFFAGDHFLSTPWARYDRSYSRDNYAVPVSGKGN